MVERGHGASRVLKCSNLWHVHRCPPWPNSLSWCLVHFTIHTLCFIHTIKMEKGSKKKKRLTKLAKNYHR